MTRIAMNIFKSLLALLFLIQLAQGQQAMPVCASRCLETHLKQSTCSATDFGCICADQQLQANVGTCTLDSCTLVEALAAKNVTATLCNEPVRDNSTTTPVVTAISGALAVIFVAIRLLNNHLRGALNTADLCAVLALVSSIPMDVIEFYMVANGFGKDIWTLDQHRINMVVKYTWISEITYVPAIGFTKICLLCFFLRVFPSRRFRYLCFGTIAFVVAFTIATFVVTIFSCNPVDFFYLGWAGDTKGTCININAFWFSQATINISVDLWIMALPLSQIRKLDLERKKKIFLCLMFCVGLLVTIFSIIRFTGLVSYSSTTNPTYNNVGAATWSVLECNVGIVCCCMPYVRSLLNRVFPNCFGGTFFSSGGKKGQKYHTMTSTTAEGGGSQKLQQQSTNATATTATTTTATTDEAGGDGGDDRRKSLRVPPSKKNVENPASAGPRRGRADTIELRPIEEGSLAKYPEW
ncbi:transcription initiation factor tfiid subunit 7 [Apiospora arundinis]